MRFRAAGRFRVGAVMVGRWVAEVWRVVTICAAVHVGWAARRMAAAPATKGAEALVPIAWTYRTWPRVEAAKALAVGWEAVGAFEHTAAEEGDDALEDDG